MLSKPGILLRIEGAALFALSLYLYRSTGAGWGLFLLLFLWPDLAMLGYLARSTPKCEARRQSLQPHPRGLPGGAGGGVAGNAPERPAIVCADLDLAY